MSMTAKLSPPGPDVGASRLTTSRSAADISRMRLRTTPRLLLTAALVGAVGGGVASYPRHVEATCFRGPCRVWTNSVLGGLHGTAPSFAIFGVVMLGAAIVPVVLVDRAARILGSSGRSARLLL